MGALSDDDVENLWAEMTVIAAAQNPYVRAARAYRRVTGGWPLEEGMCTPMPFHDFARDPPALAVQGGIFRCRKRGEAKKDLLDSSSDVPHVVHDLTLIEPISACLTTQSGGWAVDYLIRADAEHVLQDLQAALKLVAERLGAGTAASGLVSDETEIKLGVDIARLAALRKRLEQLAAEERAREAEFEERERNKGVFLRVELQALPADEGVALAKGVKRSKDKLILPPSVGASLLSQDASKNGAMLFQLSLPGTGTGTGTAAASVVGAASGGPSSPSLPHPQQSPAAAEAASIASGSGRTHAGVLEFTAPEGTVLLPRKVVQSLYGSLDAQPHGTVVVSYRRLDKGSYVRLQPMCHGFHEAMGEGLREALEAELMGHSTLTEGDWLTVVRDGREWPLRVQELQPSHAVSVLDTELAADVVPSLEAEEYLRRWEEEQRQQQARLAQLAAERAEREAAEAAERAAAEAAAAAERAQREAAEAAAAEAAAAAAAAARERLAAALPPEPEPASSSSSSDSIVTCAFSMPDGTRISRRFAADAPVQALFDFVDSRGAGGWERGSYALVTRMPRRVVGPEAAAGGRTLREVGLAAGMEAFLLEALAAPPATAARMDVDGPAKGMAAA
ncbi:hypothetical protein PLESTM_001591300 [Pleodorina starrii]|nr:hypothetical protein PLESTM_001591300 [Pleodorina starrii]